MKVLFFDIDGTLAIRKKIVPSALEALKKLKEKGYKTPEDIEKGIEDFKQKKAENNISERSYDIEKAINEAVNGEIVYKKRKRGNGNEI